MASSLDLDLRDEADDAGPEKILPLVRIDIEIHQKSGPAPVLGAWVLAPVTAEIIIHYSLLTIGQIWFNSFLKKISNLPWNQGSCLDRGRVQVTEDGTQAVIVEDLDRINFEKIHGKTDTKL